MQIHRIAHPRAFTVVSNRTAQDNALSFNALGVLTYLLSRRDGDVVNCRTLAAIRPSGRDSVASALRELKQRGYYRVLRVNDPVSGQSGDQARGQCSAGRTRWRRRSARGRPSSP